MGHRNKVTSPFNTSSLPNRSTILITQKYVPSGAGSPLYVPSQPVLNRSAKNTSSPNRLTILKNFTSEYPIPMGVNTSFIPSPFGENAVGKKAAACPTTQTLIVSYPSQSFSLRT